MTDSIQIFGRNQLHQIRWPETSYGQYAHSLLSAWMQQGTLAYIDKIDAEVQVLQTGDLIFPLVRSNPLARVHNSYVCSPVCHYLDYARAEVTMEMAQYPILRASLESLITGLKVGFVPLQFEKAIYVNNWLVSTNLYPQFDPASLVQIRDYLLKRYPDHALIFRSLNADLNQPLIQTLQSLNFASLFSRQVYLLDPAKSDYQQRHAFKEDKRLARRSEYRWLEHEDLRATDIPRLRYLYDDLYLRKYSYLNPQFNETFFRTALEQGWLRFAALQKDGRIDAVLGYFERDGVFTTPLVGYDTSLPLKTGLYRLMTLRLIQEAQQKGWILNHSSGVSKFKMLRGCQPSIEYNLVYYRHLSYTQQIPWRMIEGLSGSLMIPLVQKMGL